jgi:hypothetical protein
MSAEKDKLIDELIEITQQKKAEIEKASEARRSKFKKLRKVFGNRKPPR